MVSRRGVLRAAGLVALAAAAGPAAGALPGCAPVDPPTSAERLRVDAVGDPGPAGPAVRRTSARVLWRADTDERVLALTFDDGPTLPWTREYLDILAEAGVRGTFNVVGGNAVAHVDLLRRDLAAGHELCNHTYTHIDLGRADERHIREELERTDEALRRLTGVRPSILRPPYGHLSALALRCAADMGYDVALWDVKLYEKALDPAGNTRHVLDTIGPGSVLLAHDAGGPQRGVGVAALPGIIGEAKARGYRFVTVSELLALDRGGRAGTIPTPRRA